MYKELKRQLSDKRILEELIRGYEDRIRTKIQKQLGLHATTYTELKIECPKVEDRFLKVFSQIEELDKERIKLVEELSVINKTLKEADDLISKCNVLEKEIFRCRYIWGLSIKQTAERLNYAERHVKRILNEIKKK